MKQHSMEEKVFYPQTTWEMGEGVGEDPESHPWDQLRTPC